MPTETLGMKQPTETKVEGVNRGCRVSAVSECEATTFNESGREISLFAKYRALPLGNPAAAPASAGGLGVLLPAGRPLAGQDCPDVQQAGDCAGETSRQMGLV